MNENPKIRIFKFYPVYEKNATLPRAEYLILDNEECGSVEEYIKEYIDDETYGEVYYWSVEEVFYDSEVKIKLLEDEKYQFFAT